MQIVQNREVDIEKPIIIAAMQDMGNVGKIVLDFISKKINPITFRTIKSEFPSYIIDAGGEIEVPEEKWEYQYANNFIIFGRGAPQPQSKTELTMICKDVIEISKKYNAKMIYTVGGFHTNRDFGFSPKTYFTSTSFDTSNKIIEIGFSTTPQNSIITGFNGLILGHAKLNNIVGIGLYGELDEPNIPQYRAAISILNTLERLTFFKFGDTSELEELAKKVDEQVNQEFND